MILLLAACRPDEAPTSPADTDTTTTPLVDTAPTAPSTGDTGSLPSPTDTGPDPCATPPAVPAPFGTLAEFSTGEDFDLDGDGYLCSTGGVDANGNLLCQDRYGNSKIAGVNVTTFATGTRVLSTGEWVLNDTASGSLRRIDPKTGGYVTVASGFLNANGLETDHDGYVYIAALADGRLWQVEPWTGERWLVAEGLTAPNGVTLSPDAQTLYAASFGGGGVYAVDRIDEHSWDTPRWLWEVPPGGNGGAFDGIEVDSCGNVYVTDFGLGRVLRISPDGQSTAMLVDLPSGWIPNMKWGHGIGGWSETALYVTAFYEVYEVEVGITGKRHVSLP